MQKKNLPKAPMRKVTASDVAHRAGVSKWTVSRAFTDGASISPATLVRVKAAASALGYRPNLLARSLSKKSSRIIGVVVDELHNPNLMPLLDEVTRQLQQRGYLALLLNISQRDEGLLTLADQLQVDGLLFMGTLLSEEIIRLAQDIHHIPLVQIGRSSTHPYIQVVTTDGYQAGVAMADLLHGEGFCRFGYMKGPDTDSSQLLRFDGYRDRLLALGVDEARLTMLHANHYQRASGYHTLAHYLNQTSADRRIDALFCENDVLAIGAIEALRAANASGLMGIVGFDGIELAASESYCLTTCGQPFSELVPDAVRRLTSPWIEEHNALYPGRIELRDSHRRHR